MRSEWCDIFCLITSIQFVSLLMFSPRYGDKYAVGEISTIVGHHTLILSLSGIQITHPDLVLTTFFIQPFSDSCAYTWYTANYNAV